MDGLNECNCDAHKKVDVELLYNSVETGSQLVWRPVSWSSDELETRCGRENSTQRRGSLGLWLSSPRERERHTAMSGGAGEVNMLQSLFSLQPPLTHSPFNKVRGIFFKEVFPRLYYCVNMYSACICVCFGLVSLFNGISTLCRLFNAEAILIEEQ